jgi:hypothetical protein
VREAHDRHASAIVLLGVFVKRTILAAPAIAVLGSVLVAGAAGASELEDALRREWLGSFVLLARAAQSDCGPLFTNNEVLPGRLLSTGAYRFDAGELGHVTKIDLKRARVDLLVELVEPQLVELVDGPFTLASQVPCRVELLFALERPVVKRGDLASIDTILREVVERFDSEDDARGAEAYNRRQVEPLPENHEETWNEYTRWKMSGAIEHAGSEIERLQRKADYERDPEYALGFAAGLRHYHSPPDDCMVAAAATASYYSGSVPSGYDKDQKRDWEEGYNEGACVAFYTALLPRLSSCLVSVP